MELFEDTPGENTPEFTVSEIAGAVRRVIEGEFGWVRIRGEVGRVMHARSGHLYFDLKDDKSVLACMTWKGQIPGLGTIPEEGMEVVAEGKMSASGLNSKYSLNVQRIAVAGEGALLAMLEKRKKALAAEGLFDADRKKKIPYLPEVIGVITSPQGAVIRDILHRLRDRFPRKVLIWPVAVQGEKCAPDVANAIRGFNAFTPGGALPRPDLLIVARGGGSIEDLWGFNEEIVARAAAASAIPLISAVGHETDTTLIDFAADLRAPTPTAAAELAVPVRLDLLAWVGEQGLRMSRAVDLRLQRRKERLRDLSRLLPRAEAILDDPRQRLDRADEALRRGLRLFTDRKRAELTGLSGAIRPATLRARVADEGRRLDALAARLRPALDRRLAREREGLARNRADLDRVSPRLDAVMAKRISALGERLEAVDRVRESIGYTATLKRGYAVVRAGETLVTEASAARAAAALEIEFADGKVAVTPERDAKPPRQGSLF